MRVRIATEAEALTLVPNLMMRSQVLVVETSDESPVICGYVAICGDGGSHLYCHDLYCSGDPFAAVALFQRARSVACDNGYEGVKWDVKNDYPSLMKMKRAKMWTEDGMVKMNLPGVMRA